MFLVILSSLHLVRTSDYIPLIETDSLDRVRSLVGFRSIFMLGNSTTSISRIIFDGNLPFLNVDMQSFLAVHQCILGIREKSISPILSSGNVLLNEMTVNCPIINSLVQSSSSESLSIHSCLFRDTIIRSKLTCLGDIYCCSVSGCSFINMSCNGRNRVNVHCISSVMTDCMRSDGVMGIYGEIVSGITQYTNGRRLFVYMQ